MKKGLFFVGLIIAMTLLCCYALVAADAVVKNDTKAVSAKMATLEKAPDMPITDGKPPLRARMTASPSDAASLPSKRGDLSPFPPPAPSNDACGDAITLVVNDPNPTCENNTGATGPDCPELNYPDLWYTFTLTNECSNVAVEWCGSNLPGYLDAYLYDDCNCANPRYADDWDHTNCADGYITLYWNDLPAGQYFYPLASIDVGDFCLRVTAEPCETVPECPENTLFGQRPSIPPEYTNAFTSDTSSSHLAYDNFWEVGAPICDIHWWGLSLHFNPLGGWSVCDEDPMDFVILFYPNLAGAYGPDVSNPVCVYNVTATRQATGQLCAGYPLYYWSTTLDPCCDITNGWVSIQGATESYPTDCWFLWSISPVGDGSAYQDGGIIGYDLAFCLTEGEEEEEYDLGDLHVPCNYPSLPWQSHGHPAGNYNPAHMLSGIAWLGANITAEVWADPAGHDNAPVYEQPIGDNTDDGVTFYPPYDICQWETVDVMVTAGPNYRNEQLWLNAWKDGNLDGDFDDDNLEYCQASEWIIQDMPVTPGFYPGIRFLDPGLFRLVPYEPIFRFRLTSQPVGRHGYGLVDPLCPNMVNGTFSVDYLGEVEDYNVIEFYQLPVELTTLKAIAGDRQVTISWTTASELDNDRFDVQRESNSEWITVGTVQGTNEATGSNYQYVDRAVVNGVSYTYRLRSYDINGAVHEYDLTAEATPEAPIPVEYALDQNFPNPFNPNTTISYALKETGFVTLKVYNLLGQNVATLVQAELTTGRYTATFTAADLPSGVYVYRLEVNDFSATKKIVLMK
ncbi:T9SS type A sorting domain-containing protein [bacterium]|nr:T9SS type A sorting domain-containing protein [bacterium]